MAAPEASIESLFRHSPEPQSERGRYKMRGIPFSRRLKEALFGPTLPEWPGRQMTGEEFEATYGHVPAEYRQAVSLHDIRRPDSIDTLSE